MSIEPEIFFGFGRKLRQKISKFQSEESNYYNVLPINKFYITEVIKYHLFNNNIYI